MAFPLYWWGYRELYIALLQLIIRCAVGLSLLVSADRLLNIVKFVAIKLRAGISGRASHHAWNFATLPSDPLLYPKVAVQLPMFNERAVCQSIIDYCAQLEWPLSRLRIQVLDDSTDAVTRRLVDDRVLEWSERGVDVECVRRTNRSGYKAGAMKEGMDALLAAGFAYVAVFDADFRPDRDFLRRTIPYLEGNASLGYVQSRWVFTNPQESYLTKAQEVSLNYHMKCEQLTHSATGSFFNFNGTAGVWRASCIQSAGGWLSRTTVEDMDLSLRAYLCGWKALFLDEVTCLNELPASFFAYRKQQHRWTCGPIQLWTRACGDVWASSLPLGRKLELLLLYFGVRKCATHFVSLGLFCTLVPLTMFTPQVQLPVWALIHIPVAVTLVTSAFTRRGWVYSILYVLFENAMGMVKFWAVVNGVLDLERAQEWVVTTKLGSADQRPAASGAKGGAGVLVPSCRLFLGEFCFGLWLFAAGAYGLLSGAQPGMALYVLLQGCVFAAFGLNWVDCGGVLGGRLDDDIVRVPAGHPTPADAVAGAAHPSAWTPAPRLPLHQPDPVKRAATIPVIGLDASAQAHTLPRLWSLDASSGPGALGSGGLPSPAGSLPDSERDYATGDAFGRKAVP
ncbi:glycosyltransferase-like protein, partial [Helicosporidium sp. ATCC 50920]